jgi:hypothetical protein
LRVDRYVRDVRQFGKLVEYETLIVFRVARYDGQLIVLFTEENEAVYDLSIFSDHWNSLARWHFSIPLETHYLLSRGLATRGLAANKTCIGRVAFVEPGRKDLRLSTRSEGGLL